jgi:uncharacterized protein HemX
VSIKSHVITGAVCLVVGAALCGGLAYRISTRRIDQLGGQLEQAASANRDLTNRLNEREVMVNQLAASIRSRQGIIDAAKNELESSKNSIAKIRAILELLKANQSNSNPSSPREYYDTDFDTR